MKLFSSTILKIDKEQISAIELWYTSGIQKKSIAEMEPVILPDVIFPG